MTVSLVRCENRGNFARLKIKVCFSENGPCSNKLIKYVYLSDFQEAWLLCLFILVRLSVRGFYEILNTFSLGTLESEDINH